MGGFLWVDFFKKIPSRLKVPCFILHMYLHIFDQNTVILFTV